MSDANPGRDRVSEIFSRGADAIDREEQEYWQRSMTVALDALRDNPGDERARSQAAYFLNKLERHREGLRILEEGVQRPGASVELHHRHIAALQKCNRTEEAIEAARAAIRVFPGDVLLQFQEALLLPVLYDSPAEVDRFRCRFAAGLHDLCGRLRLDTPEQCQNASAALAGHTNFYLAYQGRNDRDLQLQYGALAYRIMAAALPGLVQPVPMPPTAVGEPLRIGYVSSRFRDVGSAQYFLGWIRERDRQRFSVDAWHVGAKADGVTEEVRGICNGFHHFPCSLQETARSIRSRNLHVLVYLDIGLDPLMTQLASLRLAPVQVMAWDHPVTSGLPTIDYALSSALAEPACAEDHYSEHLMQLPGIGVFYSKPGVPSLFLRHSRRHFGLRDQAVVYLCCQSTYKFLPENDAVFAQIAKRVPNAQFVFIATNQLVGADLQKRLDRAFAAEGLQAQDHCTLLPHLNRLDYWNLHLHGDVFLDTIGWSSGVSVIEAVARRIPVVTVPGELMRGRQGFAVLTQLGVTRTIARDNTGYVDLAAQLGTDRAFHQEVIQEMERGSSLLYSDPRSVSALEDFFRSAVSGPKSR